MIQRSRGGWRRIGSCRCRDGISRDTRRAWPVRCADHERIGDVLGADRAPCTLVDERIVDQALKRLGAVINRRH